MPDKLVTIDTFGNYLEAQLSRAKLESAGIWCFVAESRYSYDAHDVKLMVRESDAAKAVRVLKPVQKNVRRHVKHAKGVPHYIRRHEKGCPRCNSLDVEEGFSLSLSIPWISRKWKCNSCGNVWKKSS